MPRGNQNFSNQGNQQYSNNFDNAGQSMALEGIQQEIEYHTERINTLQEAANLISEGESFNEGGSGFQQGNMGNRGSFRGGRGFQSGRGGQGFHTQGTPKNEDGTDDRRYGSNRLRDDAEAYGVEDIDWDNIRYNEDESVDLRTKAGRALLSAGMVDDKGFPTDSFPTQGARGSRGGRGRSSNR